MDESALIAAYDAQVRQYAWRVSLSLYRRVSVDDLYQYGAIGLIKQFRRNPATESKILATAIRTSMIDGVRAELGRSGHTPEAASCELTEIRAKKLAAPDDRAALESAIDIPRILGKIPPDRRRGALIAIRHAQGITQAQIARELGVTQGRIGQLVRAGLANLREAAGLEG